MAHPAMRCSLVLVLAVLMVAAPGALAARGPGDGVQVVVPAPGPPVDEPRPEFSEFVAKLKDQAIAAGVSAATADAALNGLEPLEVVVERDRSQAEVVLTIDQYVQRRLTRTFVRTAVEQQRAHRAELSAIAKKYGVPSSVIVAI